MTTLREHPRTRYSVKAHAMMEPFSHAKKTRELEAIRILTVRCRDAKTRYSWAECWHSQDPTAEEVHHLSYLPWPASSVILLHQSSFGPPFSARPRSRRKRLNYLLHTADTTPHPIQSSSRARDGVPRLFPSGLCSTQR